MPAPILEYVSPTTKRRAGRHSFYGVAAAAVLALLLVAVIAVPFPQRDPEEQVVYLVMAGSALLVGAAGATLARLTPSANPRFARIAFWLILGVLAAFVARNF